MTELRGSLVQLLLAFNNNGGAENSSKEAVIQICGNSRQYHFTQISLNSIRMRKFFNNKSRSGLLTKHCIINILGNTLSLMFP